MIRVLGLSMVVSLCLGIFTAGAWAQENLDCSTYLEGCPALSSRALIACETLLKDKVISAIAEGNCRARMQVKYQLCVLLKDDASKETVDSFSVACERLEDDESDW